MTKQSNSTIEVQLEVQYSSPGTGPTVNSTTAKLTKADAGRIQGNEIIELSIEAVRSADGSETPKISACYSCAEASNTLKK